MLGYAVYKGECMPVSVVISAFVAVFVGFIGSVPVVLAALQAVSATTEQMISGFAAMCLGIAATTIYFCHRYRMPIVTAWSFPGCAVIASSQGVSFAEYIGACLCAAGLLIVTGASGWLSALVKRLPVTLAAAMLAGLLFSFVIKMFSFIQSDSVVVLGVLLMFFIVRIFWATWAVIAALLAGGVLVFAQGYSLPTHDFAVSNFVLIAPDFRFSVLIGVGLPLYLVTMVSQNLTGLAVLKASGYDDVPSQGVICGTGLASGLSAPFGALSTNLAAITAAMCTGPDCHSDPRERWKTGYFYALGYTLLAIFAAGFLDILASLPPALIASITGVALLGPFMTALVQSVSERATHLAATTTFVITASGISVLGIGAPFWGLCAGLSILAIQKIHQRFSA